MPKSSKRTISIPDLKLSGANPILVTLLVVAAFLIGTMYTKISYLEKGTGTTAPTVAQAPNQPNQPAAPTTTQNTVTLDTIKGLFNSNTIHFGDSNRKNLIVEISDPSCPFCHLAGGENPELNQQSGGQFTLVSQGGTYVPPVPEMRKLVDSGSASFVWIYFPGHGAGEMGTKALYCANEKGKFWEVHDKIMSNAGYNLLNNTVKNDKTQSQALADFLSGVFPASDMKNCLDSGKYDSKISGDQALAMKLFPNPATQAGTPGFYINTTFIGGASSWDSMKSAVK